MPTTDVMDVSIEGSVYEGEGEVYEEKREKQMKRLVSERVNECLKHMLPRRLILKMRRVKINKIEGSHTR